MGRGISSPISAAIIGFTIVALAIYTTYVTVNAILQVYTTPRGNQHTECGYIRLVNSTLYPNNTIEIVIENDGPSTVASLDDLGMALVLYANSSQYTYSLRYCGSPAPGCWVAESIAVGSKTFEAYSKRPFRPGETLYAKAFPPIQLTSADYSYLAVFTGCSRAERVIIPLSSG
ncbi:MAG: hypothetical protein QW348_00350 [Ignisphaera sp.]